MLKKFRVVSVSKNTNSSGLYGVIIAAQDGETYEIAVGSIYKPEPYQELDGVMSKSGVVLMQIIGIDYELPRKLRNTPKEIIDIVFKHQPTSKAA